MENLRDSLDSIIHQASEIRDKLPEIVALNGGSDDIPDIDLHETDMNLSALLSYVDECIAEGRLDPP